MSIETNDPCSVPPLPRYQRFQNVTAVLVDRIALIRLPNGKVYTSRSGGIDLSDVHSDGKALRSAWCALAGVRRVDMQARIKERRAELAEEGKQDRLADLQSDARELGYRLVKDRSPNPLARYFTADHSGDEPTGETYGLTLDEALNVTDWSMGAEDLIRGLQPGGHVQENGIYCERIK